MRTECVTYPFGHSHCLIHKDIGGNRQSVPAEFLAQSGRFAKKRLYLSMIKDVVIAPPVGAWIETLRLLMVSLCAVVPPPRDLTARHPVSVLRARYRKLPE